MLSAKVAVMAGVVATNVFAVGLSVLFWNVITWSVITGPLPVGLPAPGANSSVGVWASAAPGRSRAAQATSRVRKRKRGFI